MNLIEQRHILRTVAARVRNYKELGADSHRWSCDVCGDSARDRNKARFYVGRKDNDLLCFCHNCNFSGSLLSYLRIAHPDLAESLTVNSFVKQETTSMVDYDAMVSRLNEDVLQHLFGLNEQDWVRWLLERKIVLSKKSMEKLYNIRKGRKGGHHAQS